VRQRGRERRSRAPRRAPVELQTPFQHAEVVADPFEPSLRTLLLDGREAGQIDVADPRRLTFAYMRRIGDLIDAFRPPGAGIDVLHVGGGAFALARYVAATRPSSRNDVFELDPGVVQLAREQLALRTTPRLRVHLGDAAALLPARGERVADLVIGDAFEGPDVPAALSTPDWVEQIRRVLKPAGVYALNVVDVPPNLAVEHHAALLRERFAHSARIGPPGVLRARSPGNVVLLAADVALPLEALRRAAAAAIPRELVAAQAATSCSSPVSTA
jgi:SAM-dependent methyltransferase